VPTKEEPARIDPIVVTATMSPTSLEKLGAAVTVITGEEITNLKLRSDRGPSSVKSGRSGPELGISPARRRA
jgi:outer membrane receptor protein involved in Fe transport